VTIPDTIKITHNLDDVMDDVAAGNTGGTVFHHAPEYFHYSQPPGKIYYNYQRV